MPTEIERINYPSYEFMQKYEICIPIIQREYIQGSEDEKIKNATDRLIDDVLSVLEGKKESINLNIIYGYEYEDDNGKRIFYPIDGQQRLTLLYLMIWYCAVRSDLFDDFKINIKKFYYETRESSKKFFETILIQERDIKNIFEDQEDISEGIRSKLWFQVDWNNDITIHSILAIIDKLHKRITVDQAKVFYKKWKEDPCIVFDVCIEDRRDAKLKASASYLSLNARGKMLENFENVKSLLEKLEMQFKEDNFFSEQYDLKYIDVFYNSVDSSQSLEEKTKEINQKSITFLINAFHLVNTVFYDNKFDIEEESKMDSFEEFYQKLYQFQGQDSEMLKKYFSFIHKVLLEFYKAPEIIQSYPNIQEIWENEESSIFRGKKSKEEEMREQLRELFRPGEYKKKDICDSDNIVMHLLYLYYNEYPSKEGLDQLTYVLKNLKYSSIEQPKYTFAKYISDKLKEQDIYTYLNGITDIEKMIEEIHWTNDYNDLKCSLKEQIIKFKIIQFVNDRSNDTSQKWKYNYFQDIEEKNDQRQIYYLLYISGLWNHQIMADNDSEEKIKLLHEYLSLGDSILYSTALVMKKWFAIANYYDVGEDKLVALDIMNVHCNFLYKRDEEVENLHKLEKRIYHLNDNQEYGADQENKETNNYKLNAIKIAYDILKKLRNKEDREKWLSEKFNSDYDDCWLKYAVYRNYEELFDKRISYIDGDVYITVKFVDLGDRQVKFGARVLFLDLKEKDKSIDGYQESIWSYDTEHIDPSGNRKKENGIILNEFYGSDKPNNYISQFPVPIFNFTYREKEIDPEWESLRWFFYRLDKILFDKKNIFDSFDERVDTVFKIKDKTISLFRFTDCYEYEEFVYSLNDDIEALKNGSERFKKSLRTLPDNFEAFQKNYSSWKMHVYKRRDEMVYKYEDNSEIVKNVGIDSFQKVDQTLLEIYSLKYLEI